MTQPSRSTLLAITTAPVLAVVFGTASPARSDWPGHDFKMVVGESVANTERAEALRDTVEAEAEAAAAYFDAAGFGMPRLIPRGNFLERKPGMILPYEVWLESAMEGTGADGLYEHDLCVNDDLWENEGDIRISLQRYGNAPAAQLHHGIAHELSHAIQYHSPVAAGCNSSFWLRDALAEGAGFLSAHNAHGGAQSIEDLLGSNRSLRSYAQALRPSPSESVTEDEIRLLGYKTGAFFYWAGLRYGGAEYLASLYERPLPASESQEAQATAEIAWIDRGMTAAEPVRTGLEFLFPQFVADYGSWRESLIAPEGIASQEDWMTQVFGGPCAILRLTPEDPFDQVTLGLDAIAAKCIEVQIDEDVPEGFSLDTFAYVAGGSPEERTELQRLDSLHLAGVYQQSYESPRRTCADYSGVAASRTWPVCVVKPFMQERGDAPTLADVGQLTRTYTEAAVLTGQDAAETMPEDLFYVRLWNSEDHYYDEPGARTIFALVNVAPDPEETILDTYTFVAGLRMADPDDMALRLGPPVNLSQGNVPAGLGGIAQQMLSAAAAGIDVDPSAALASAAASYEMGYAEYGISGSVSLGQNAVALNIPVIDANGEKGGGIYMVALTDLPPLGQTGTAKAVVIYGEDSGLMASHSPCESDRDHIQAQILSSGIEGVRFAIATEMYAFDLQNPMAGCRPWKPLTAQISMPFGWPFDAAMRSRDVVSPGLHAYVERYLAGLRERGIPMADVSPFPGREPELVTVRDSEDGPSSDGGEGSAVDAACDCSCEAMDDMMGRMEALGEDSNLAMLPEMMQLGGCMQQCMPQLIACRAGGD